MARSPAIVALLFLSACTVKAQHEQRYTGLTVPQGSCGATSAATLTTARAQFAFAPTDGTLLVTGTVGPDGTLEGSLTTTGADHKPFVMHLSATITGEAVTGTYTTPRCAFTVTLALVHPPLL